MNIESIKKVICDVFGQEAADDLRKIIEKKYDVDLGIFMGGEENEQKSA